MILLEPPSSTGLGWVDFQSTETGSIPVGGTKCLIKIQKQYEHTNVSTASAGIIYVCGTARKNSVADVLSVAAREGCR